MRAFSDSYLGLCGQQSQQKGPDLFLQHFGGIPKPAKRHNLSSLARVYPGFPLGTTCPKHISWLLLVWKAFQQLHMHCSKKLKGTLFNHVSFPSNNMASFPS